MRQAMGVLQDFERRLEGAVEGFFARAFRSGMQPVELAKALQRYAEDHRHVAEDGVVVPNEYRFFLSHRDLERLSEYGDHLHSELADVVERTAADRDWRLRGPARVTIEPADRVRYGRYELTGRVAVGARPRPAAPPPPAGQRRPPPAPAAGNGAPATEVVRPAASRPAVVAPNGARFELTAGRHTVGRLEGCDLVIDDGTVSREHAAIVRRGDRWWVLDLGSTNGTTVNGVQAAEHPLHDRDQIELGDAVLLFEEPR